MPLVRRRPEDKSETWTPTRSIRLYLDDVDEILAVLKQIDSDVQVVTNDFEGSITSGEDLKVVGSGSTSDVVLSAGSDDHGVAVQLCQRGGVRVVPRDDLSIAGAGQRVRELLVRRQQRFGSPMYTLLGFSFALLVLGIAGGFASAFDSASNDVSEVSLVIGMFGMGLALSAGTVFPNDSYFGRHPTISVVLAYRADAPTWWERNRTAVIVNLMTNALVGSGFFVLGRLFEQ